MSRLRPTDECERVADAIADGRFLEDPAFWRPHVESCPLCKPRVEGLFLLRAKIHAAAGAAPLPPPGQGPGGAMGRAFTRFRVRRRRQQVAGFVLAGVLLAGGAWVGWPRSGRGQGASDSITYAERLYHTVFLGGGKVDRDRLQRDDALRSEFLEALDNPSSCVRRSALVALTWSGISVDPERLAKILGEWREDLETPVEVAGVDAGAQELYAALARRRIATVDGVASTAYLQAVRGGPHVAPMALEPLLSEPNEGIRRQALNALELNPDYRPGDRVWTLLRHDPSVQVRWAAATCLMRRLGESGTRAVLEHVREARDYALEDQILPGLSHTAGAAEISRLRVSSPETPIPTALWHALLLVRTGEKAPPAPLVERALGSGSPAALWVLATVCAEADWTQYRARLQEAWSAAPAGGERRTAGAVLVGWDVASGDPARIDLALDIVAEEDHPTYAKVLRTLAEHRDPKIRARAEQIVRARPPK